MSPTRTVQALDQSARSRPGALRLRNRRIATATRCATQAGPAPHDRVCARASLPSRYPGQLEVPTDEVPTVLTKLQKWGDYDSVGEPVWPTRFVPMKTPLARGILDNWSLPERPKHRLTVPELLSGQAKLGRKVRGPGRRGGEGRAASGSWNHARGNWVGCLA